MFILYPPPNSGKPAPRPGALAEWRAEIAAGPRRNTTTDFDELAAAAAAEAAGLEEERRGDRAAAERWYAVAWCRLAGCWDAPDSPAGRRALEWLALATEELEREARPAPAAPAPARRVVPLHRRPPAPPPARWAPRGRAAR